MATVYLDVDDEITSVAARIRDSADRRVAIVLPHGSRVATSRINFRLLARDALTHEKRLSIVAADAATRALAASAGLPVFGSVGEYESSMEPRDTLPDDEPTPAPAKRRSKRTAAAAAAAAGAAGAAGASSDAGAAGASGAAIESATAGGHSTSASPPSGTPDDATGTMAMGLAASATVVTGPATRDAAAPPSAVPGRTARAGRPPMATPIGTTGATGAGVAGASGPMGGAVVATPVPVERIIGPRLGRTPVLVGVAVLGLAAVVGAVGAYLILPSASVVVAPRQETVGPLRMTVTASTTATEPDPAAAVVPAEEASLDVEASGTFETTGKRVEEEKATGTVQFSNKDFTASETVPKGSVVSTPSGVRFRTNSAVRVPQAELVGLSVFPATANVRVTAVEAGEDGNVEPNAITVVPRGESPETLSVRNPDATKGGTREEFARISEKDVDAAVASLAEDLETAFAERLRDPDLTTGGATVFPDTAALGDPTFSVDPETLVGEEVETFQLGADATGTVTVVDATAVEAVAEQRLLAGVSDGYRLVDGSSSVTVDPAVVSDGSISFPVVASAREIALLDAAQVEAAIRGRSIADAQSILAEYGTAELSVWPDWVSAIPTIDGRVDVTISEPVTIESSSPAPSPDDGTP